MNLEDVDFINKQSAYFAKHATMTDRQIEEMVADFRELKKLLTPRSKT
jgi:hypothetical protein